MLGRILQIVIKEFIELRRDRWARFRLIIPPLLQILVFGYAATFEVFGVSTAVLDQDRTAESRELVSRFTFGGRFHVAFMQSQAEIERAIDRGDAVVALVIHPGFSQLLRKGEEAPLQVIVDGTNSNSALIALGYLGEITNRFSQDYAGDFLARTRGGGGGQGSVQVSLEPRPWYNPGFNSRWFFVPGVIGTVTLIMIANLTAFGIVREREVGTLEQLMVTPIRPFELIIGKTVPFFLVGLALVALIALFGILWFQIPFVGNPLLMLLGTSLFLLSTLGLGLLISTLCVTQQQAFASQFFILNPMFILSGFSFPISSMPTVLQWLTYLDPLRYFLVVIRATFLKGVGMAALWPDFLGLALLGGGLLALSAIRFRKSLD